MTAKDILDHPVISSRYFFPRRSSLQDPFVVTTDGVELHCHRSAPHDGGPWLWADRRTGCGLRPELGPAGVSQP